jgi:hypothetical protein
MVTVVLWAVDIVKCLASADVREQEGKSWYVLMAFTEAAGMIGDRWGVTDSETARAYPCDEYVASPALRAWRGVHVAAPVGAVWPWVAQVRLAPYSYDWIDNRGRRSPRDLAGLPEPRAGDQFTTAGGRPRGRIVSVEAGKQLTGAIGGAYMSYVLVPQDDDSTRLLLKVVMRTTRLAALALCTGDLIMARRQLLNLKHLAERHHRGTRGLRLPNSSTMA